MKLVLYPLAGFGARPEPGRLPRETGQHRGGLGDSRRVAIPKELAKHNRRPEAVAQVQARSASTANTLDVKFMDGMSLSCGA